MELISDLLTCPRSQASDLGLPMPDDPHAVSACLPLWEHNIGYEEGRPEVIDRLQAAYPRFCFHPIVKELSDRFLSSDGKQGLPFVSPAAARRAVDYVKHAADVDAEMVALPGQTATGVVVSEQHFTVLKQYWQHAGENVSSRVAELILNNTPATCEETAARTAVRNRIGQLQEVQTPAENVFLFSSGMAAIAATWRSVQELRNGASCQFGFPYVDTLKIQERFPGATHTFLPIGDQADLDKLEELCRTDPPAVIFCEVPTNPLLVTPNLKKLRTLADEHDILLVVDDTLAACGNLSALPLADVVVTSLTKYFSGQGNVLAGSLVINPQSHHFAELRHLISEDFEETLSDIDVEVLNENSADFPQRVSIINSNAHQLADFLRQHNAVASVFYPSQNDAEYETLRNPDGGYGGLMSIVLNNAEQVTPAVFDALNVCKGPNLGTNFTLCCPYTILAHYNELDFAERCGVSRWLLRISVGVEPIDELIQRFDEALKTAV